MKIRFLSENRITIGFPEENKIEVVAGLLKYLHYFERLNYYIFFGYEDYNIDISKYRLDYPELKEDRGFFKLKSEDYNNVELICDILYEYQTASLYINKLPDLVERYTLLDMRHINSPFAGYIIKELREDYIVIKKDINMPKWDLEKMGIPLESIIKDNESTEKNSLSDGILSSVKRLFTRFKK